MVQCTVLLHHKSMFFNVFFFRKRTPTAIWICPQITNSYTALLHMFYPFNHTYLISQYKLGLLFIHQIKTYLKGKDLAQLYVPEVVKATNSSMKAVKLRPSTLEACITLIIWGILTVKSKFVDDTILVQHSVLACIFLNFTIMHHLARLLGRTDICIDMFCSVGGGLPAEACVKALHAAVENQLSMCDLNRFSHNAHSSRSQEWLYTCTISSSCAILCVLIVWQNFSKNRLLLLI